MSFDYLQSYNIHPHKIVSYQLYIGKRSIRKRNDRSLLNLLTNNHRGRISGQARNKITNYINIILAQAKVKRFYSVKDQATYSFRVNFITLTLPSTQIHTDQQIKKECLNQFLTEMRRKMGGVKYFWRAEKQTNGNIHFHLLTDKFYHWRDIRQDWNRIIGKLGYVDRFQSLHGHRDPNSTDVHAIKKIKNLGAYLSKYCTKQSGTSIITGRNYGVSQSVVKYCKVSVTEADIESQEIESIAEIPGVVTQSNEYMTVLYGNIDKVLKAAKSDVGKIYRDNLRVLFESG